MKPEYVLFAFFSVLATTSALGVLLFRNPIRGAMSLIVCFFSLACLYLLQHAELLAVLEVLVYAGAIMVLFVFVLMLVENKEEPVFVPTLSQRLMVPVKAFAVFLLAANIIGLILRSRPWSPETLPPGFGGVRFVGLQFFESFLFQFELTSLLLLVGMIGAVIVSKRR